MIQIIDGAIEISRPFHYDGEDIKIICSLWGWSSPTQKRSGVIEKRFRVGDTFIPITDLDRKVYAVLLELSEELDLDHTIDSTEISKVTDNYNLVNMAQGRLWSRIKEVGVIVGDNETRSCAVVGLNDEITRIYWDKFFSAFSQEERDELWRISSNDGCSLINEHYHTYEITKKSGGTRVISAPDDLLKKAQEKILHSVLYKYWASWYAHGGVPKRSQKTMATPHVGKDRYLLKCDITKFFDNCYKPDVERAVRRVVTFSGDPSLVIAIQDRLVHLCLILDHGRSMACLPQGAPTSMALGNVILEDLDGEMARMIEACCNDGRYTRYVDDLVFSSQEDMGFLVPRIKRSINKVGFHISNRKITIKRPNQKRKVVGIVVNEKVSIPRRKRRKMRAAVHNARQAGVQLSPYVKGMISYFNGVNPEQTKRQVINE